MTGHTTLIECPRDAWQGLAATIPAAEKAAYLLLLAECGFRHIDAVSFVSPRYVPQMADSETVMAVLDRARIGAQGVEIIGIAVNDRGLARALATPGVGTVGYPHSLSETFLGSNAHTTVAESRALVGKLARATEAAGRSLVVYVSMAFGNPYGEPWSAEAVAEEVARLKEAGAKTISLADTAGVATPETIRRLLATVLGSAGGTPIGVHLHSRREDATRKILAALDSGCRRFDSALTGLGGCPFAGDELVGNIPTELVWEALESRGMRTGIEPLGLERALESTREIRRRYADT